MVDEQDNLDSQGEEKEDLFEIDESGEAAGYISLDQARVLAMQTASREPGAYGREFRGVSMAFEVAEENETEDHYVVTLSLRPQGEYTGTSGQEQFFIEKEGQIAHRQVLSLPRPESGRRFPVTLVVVLVAVLGIGGAAAVFASGALNSGAPGSPTTITPVSTVQTAIPAVAALANTPPPTEKPTSTPTHTPSPTPKAAPTAAPAVRPTATSIPRRIPALAVTVTRRSTITPTPTRIRVPTPTPLPTITPTRTRIPTPTRTRTPIPPPTRTNTPTPTDTPPAPLILERGVAGVYFDEADGQPRTGAPDSIMLVFNLPLDSNSIQPSDFRINGAVAENTFWTGALRNRLFILTPFDLPEGREVDISLVGQIAARNGAVLSNVDGTIPPAPTATPTPPAFTPTPIAVPDEAVFFDGHYYRVVNASVPWRDAAAISRNENGHLVTITSARENDFVYNLATSRGVNRYWIGLTDQEIEGKFRWITGESFIYANWRSGEPNNSGDEDYAEIGIDSNSEWNDEDRDHEFPFIIEYDEFGGKPPTNVPPPTPTPTALPEPPNLIPTAPAQWDAPLVTSAIKTSFLNVPPPLEDHFTTGQEIYLSWAIGNDSPTAATKPFIVGVAVDGSLEMTFEVPRLDSGAVYRELNQPLVIDEPGQHELVLLIDIEDRIDESVEDDNVFFISAVWQARANIVFVSNRDGNDEIYTMAADGTSQTRLTFEPTFDGFPAWSPDGTMIAFESARDGNNEIYVMNADGTNQHNITNHKGLDSAPTWSPDGSRITFVSKRDGGDFEIYVMNADGSGQTRLTDNSAIDDFPSWSPDGSLILFESNRAGNFDIYAMKPDGAIVEKVTRKTSSDNQARWSPDGSKIAFVSNRDGNNEIYLRNLVTSKLTRLTFADGVDSWPNWSPDGGEIVFYSDRDGDNDIYVVAADGSARAQLTGNSDSDTYPDWAPR